MSRYYATISGQAKTNGTRRGSTNSGIWGHIRGWNIGVMIYNEFNEKDDIFEVFLTGGSNDPSCKIKIGSFSKKDLEGAI